MTKTNHPLVLLLMLAATTGLGCHRRVKPRPIADKQGTPESESSMSPPVAARASSGKWRSDSCDEPCCGGTACKVTTGNAEHAACRGGLTNCNKCASGLTCIPGACTAILPRGERWELRVSYVSGGSITDVCQSDWVSAFVCLRSTGTEDWTCLSLADSCANNGHGQQGATVTTEDLTTRGLDIEVRRGSAEGSIVASRSNARYAGGIMTRALCTGLKFDHLKGSPGIDIDSVAFFLEPPL